MVWDAHLGGSHSPDQELEIARDLQALASKHGASVGFWTSNTPIDIGNLSVETETVAPDTPPLKADSKKAKR